MTDLERAQKFYDAYPEPKELGHCIPQLMADFARSLDEKEQRNFRWAYAAIVALAKRHLADMNAAREDEHNWAAGQDWDDLNGSSRSILLRAAREECGISHDEFLEGIRNCDYEVGDLYGE